MKKPSPARQNAQNRIWISSNHLLDKRHPQTCLGGHRLFSCAFPTLRVRAVLTPAYRESSSMRTFSFQADRRAAGPVALGSHSSVMRSLSCVPGTSFGRVSGTDEVTTIVPNSRSIIDRRVLRLYLQPCVFPLTRSTPSRLFQFQK